MIKFNTHQHLFIEVTNPIDVLSCSTEQVVNRNEPVLSFEKAHIFTSVGLNNPIIP